MLIEFNVKNFRSIWGTQTLTMTAGASRDLQEENSFEAPLKGVPRLLRSAVIYGPNGAGKSNLIAAIEFMQNFVLNSSKERQEGDSTGRVPFRLYFDGPSLPSEFEVFFIQEGIRFQYGFCCTESQVTHEWLFAYPGNRAQRWFERSYDPETQKTNYEFGSKLIGPKKTWEQNTRPNALFLSTAVQLNSEQLKTVFTWFRNLVVISHGEMLHPGFTIKNCKEEKTKQGILKFLMDADVNITDIDLEERKISAEEVRLPSDMPQHIQNIIKNEVVGSLAIQVKLKHKMNDSSDGVYIQLDEESDGTQKLFAYAGPWLDLLNSGRVLIVDELNNSFHPHLVRFLLKLIHNSSTNKGNGQLVFSTHDPTLLDLSFLRKDQVWFVQKDDNESSQLYSLSDFRPRKGEALEKGYLQGRYGALPYISEVTF